MNSKIILKARVTGPQADFHALTCKFPAFVGGYGSGKTETMCNQAINDALESPNALISIYEPTYDLISLIVVPRIEEKLENLKVRYRYNKTANRIFTRHPQIGNFIFRSLDKPGRIVGYEAYRAHVDEIDTLPIKQAQLAWQKIIARTRQKPKGMLNPYNRVSAYTTPEGFRFVQKRWVKQKNERYQHVTASSYSNPWLDQDYIDSLIASYPPQLVEAYIEGRFVNLTSGTVYNCYNREGHNSTETILPRETLYIGNDFNITKMAATIYVRRDGGRVWHSVDELVNVYDTPELCRVIKERYKDRGHHIVMYPDASGKKRNSADGSANASDMAILRQHGFEIRVNPSNPAVRDRINATNAAFTKGVLFINADRCPNVADCLEQQVYDSNGEPLKDGVDHQNDASTYPISYEMPIKRPHSHINVHF